MIPSATNNSGHPIGKISKSSNGYGKDFNFDKAYNKLILQKLNGKPEIVRPNILSKRSRLFSNVASKTEPQELGQRASGQKSPQQSKPLSTAASFATNSNANTNVGQANSNIGQANSKVGRACSVTNSSSFAQQIPVNVDSTRFQLNDGRILSFCGSLELNGVHLISLNSTQNNVDMKFDYQSLLKHLYRKNNGNESSTHPSKNVNTVVSTNCNNSVHSYAIEAPPPKINIIYKEANLLPGCSKNEFHCEAKRRKKSPEPPVSVIDCRTTVFETVTVKSSITDECTVVSSNSSKNGFKNGEAKTFGVASTLPGNSACSSINIVDHNNDAVVSQTESLSINHRTGRCLNRISKDESLTNINVRIPQSINLPMEQFQNETNVTMPKNVIFSNNNNTKAYADLNIEPEFSPPKSRISEFASSLPIRSEILPAKIIFDKGKYSTETLSKQYAKKVTQPTATTTKKSNYAVNGRKSFLNSKAQNRKNSNNNWRLWLNNCMKPKKACKKRKINRSTQTDNLITEFSNCARHIPYDQMRKERNWFYFYIHQARTSRPVFNAKSKIRDLNNFQENYSQLKTGKIAAVQAMHYNELKRKPPKLTVNRSPIHKIGVFANQNIRIGTFLIEYVGELVRNNIVERREQRYREQGLGSYMFRLDHKFTVDATFKGCIARFINHSCEPNCIARIIRVDKVKHIILIASKNIKSGDEICYDYKLPKEDEKMPCLCSTRFCRKYIN